MRNILLGITLFFVVFGLKMGVLDTSLIFSSFLLLTVLLKSSIKVNKSFIVILIMLLFLCLYSFFISFAYSFPDSYTILRTIRGLINTFCIGLFFINYPQKPKTVTAFLIMILAVNNFAAYRITIDA